jgi:hypothetical protein
MTLALAANALTDLATIKDELSISGSTLDDRLTRLINEASDAIERYCRRKLTYAEVESEPQAPSGTGTLVLDRYPLIEVTEIRYDEAVVDASQYVVEDAESGIVRRMNGVWLPQDLTISGSPSQDGVPGTGRKIIAVDYAGGYVTPNQVADELPRTLPYDLERACLSTVTQLYRQRGRDTSIASEQLGDAQVSYRLPNAIIGTGAGGPIPDEVLPLLSRYRRNVF